MLDILLLLEKFSRRYKGLAPTQEAEKTAGFVRIVAREDDHRVLGVQGVEPTSQN